MMASTIEPPHTANSTDSLEARTDGLSISDDKEWELEEGIPQFSDPFIQKYFKGRDALINQEDKHRSDGDFRELLSPLAREASAIVGQIRFEERQTVWTNQAEHEVAEESQGPVYPGMMFTLAKNRMKSTRLWQIMKRMPKGALLHCHLEAMVDQEWLFREALATEGLCMCAPRSLVTESARSTELFAFQYAASTPKLSASIWSADYTQDNLIPLTTAADSFPDDGREGFIEWLISRCSITPEESFSVHEGPACIWSKFTSCFIILKTLVYYEPIYRKFLRRMFQQFADDNIQYADLRAAFAFDYFKEHSDTPLSPEDGYSEVIRILGEETEKFQATEAGKDFWGARMIWTTIRAFSNREIIESMRQLITIKATYPNLISGFDLVGHEDPGRTLADLTPSLFWFRKSCAEANLNIPFFFHAGETLGTGTEADTNLFDALTLGTRRIGHGFSLYKHPLLMNMVRDRRICVEVCPISNEILRLTGSVNAHPLPALLANGVPVTIGNDDPAILGQDDAGLSYDFYQCLQGIESLGLDGLGALAENSVRYAAFEDLDNKVWTEDCKAGRFGKGVRALRMKEWARKWERFCQWVVLEFGADVDLEPEE